MTFDLSRPNFARFTIGLFGYFVTENREDDTQTDKRTHTHTCTHTRNLVLLNYKVCKSVGIQDFPSVVAVQQAGVGLMGLSHCLVQT